MKKSNRLAIDGGVPVVKDSLPSGVSGPSVVDEEEVEAVARLLRSQKLFRYRPDSECNLLELEAAELLGVKYALAVNSGTAALVCAMKGVGLGPGDEAIVPGYTYIATVAAVVAAGAVPVIAEIDDSLGLDPSDVERKITKYTKAIVPVHMRGVPNRLDSILTLARRHRLKVVEDCSQCVGGAYKARRVGTYGDVGTWSLNYYKTISTGEGGLLYTNDRDVFERACFASDPGLPMWGGEDSRGIEFHQDPFPGETYRPSELVGAVGRVQLRKLDGVLAHQRRLKKAFLAELDEPRAYRLQHVDDPAGDTGVSAGVIVQDEELARGYAHALKAEGVPVGTIYNAGIPDRHIYSAWDSILNKRSHHPSGYPWKDPAYRGDVQYSKDMCPQTLDLLGRTLLLNFNMNMAEEHARAMARALNKVDAALGT
ncbi:MAG: glutamine--scyllo-inositol aminotransferase [SAR202 cluster bacterium]|nr:glutamine--scyllo-inositol aminotransferase [SAR202 cluster bacterium]